MKRKDTNTSFYVNRDLIVEYTPAKRAPGARKSAGERIRRKRKKLASPKTKHSIAPLEKGVNGSLVAQLRPEFHSKFSRKQKKFYKLGRSSVKQAQSLANGSGEKPRMPGRAAGT